MTIQPTSALWSVKVNMDQSTPKDYQLLKIRLRNEISMLVSDRGGRNREAELRTLQKNLRELESDERSENSKSNRPPQAK